MTNETPERELGIYRFVNRRRAKEALIALRRTCPSYWNLEVRVTTGQVVYIRCDYPKACGQTMVGIFALGAVEADMPTTSECREVYAGDDACRKFRE